jgi:hypothetical protein
MPGVVFGFVTVAWWLAFSFRSVPGVSSTLRLAVLSASTTVIFRDLLAVRFVLSLGA